MDILLINPPYQTITSNLGVGHQIPLGLLMIGGPLRDAGHSVRLLDAERRRLSVRAVAAAVRDAPPHVVMTGHAGSTPAHPICLELLRQIKRVCPEVLSVYGGVYPTYHAERILRDEPAVDFVVRGEGEATTLELARALAAAAPAPELARIPGVALRVCGRPLLSAPRPPIADLDRWRVGWELIEDWDDYRCFGLGRAAIVQFSRGCPHRCTYCGQHDFWQRWRHRNPVRLADEIAWLSRTHRIRFITLADENPTTHPQVWRRFLEAMSARQVPVHFFATIRATDIVRDAELGMLPLYRRAGILYVLMGVESTNDGVLQRIGKNSSTRHDVRACHLLREHGIFSVLGHIAGFEDETWRSFAGTLRRLSKYDADYLNAMYVTPHDWTPFGRSVLARRVVEPDQRRWDYRHQVLPQKHLRPWQLLTAVKALELLYHLRPRRLARFIAPGDPLGRRQLWWCGWHIGRVWLAEVAEFAWRSVQRAWKRVHRSRSTPAARPADRSAPLPLPVIHARDQDAMSGRPMLSPRGT